MILIFFLKRVKYLKIFIDFNTYLELENHNGSFFPLQGFMEADDYYSVCEKMRLKMVSYFPYLLS